MTNQEKDRIECAIRHIESSLDVDPWACEIAVDAIKRLVEEKMAEHGRLIDADALIEEINKRIKSAYEWYDDKLRAEHAIATFCEVYLTVKKMPTIEPERKRGKWILQDHNKKNGNITTCVYYFPVCSECGNAGEDRFSFCPNCGSDMRESEGEDG